MMISVRLQAIVSDTNNNNEIIRNEYNQRPDILLTNEENNNSVFLGKNATTGIADFGLMRRVIRITWNQTNNVLRLYQIPRKNNIINNEVSLNGVILKQNLPLQNNDIITLHTSQSNYEYKVIIDGTIKDNNNNNNENKEIIIKTSDNIKNGEATQHIPSSAEDKEPPSSSSIPLVNITSIVDELICPCCLGIYVDPTTLFPCGHIFCKECIPNQGFPNLVPMSGFNTGKCPMCRGYFERTAPCKDIREVIFGLVGSCSEMFEHDDVITYKRRAQQSKLIPYIPLSTEDKEPPSSSSSSIPPVGLISTIVEFKLTCLRCWEIYVDPTTLFSCGHIFCKECIPDPGSPNLIPMSGKCPMCMNYFEQTAPCKNINNIITRIMESRSESEIFIHKDVITYQRRTQQNKRKTNNTATNFSYPYY